LIWWWTRKRIIGNKWRAEEEERHKGVTDKKKTRGSRHNLFCGHGRCDLKQQTWNRNISHIRQNLIHNSAII
jgi:hypothetical protein